jgi:plasmid stability protein
MPKKSKYSGHFSKLAAAAVVASTRPGRGADQFIIRMPPGMRDAFAKRAAEHGRSMNAELVAALTAYLANDDGEVDTTTIKNSLSELKKEVQFVKKTLSSGYFERHMQSLLKLTDSLIHTRAGGIETTESETTEEPILNAQESQELRRRFERNQRWAREVLERGIAETTEEPEEIPSVFVSGPPVTAKKKPAK